jgi:16S rRNA processing protein RimM
MSEVSEKVVLGKFGAAHGIKGWVRVISYSRPPEDILQYNPWLIEQDQEWRQVNVVDGRLQGKFVIAKLEGIDDCNTAEALTHIQIAVQSEQLPVLTEGDYFWKDLQGLAVIDQQGNPLGKIDRLIETGANDVLVVRGENKKELLLPYIDDVVKKVDLKQQVMTVEWDAS